MPRQRSPQREKAFELWKESGGKKPLIDIAVELGVSDVQVRKWKNQDKWEAENKPKTAPDKPGKRNSNVTKRKSNVTVKLNGVEMVPMQDMDYEEEHILLEDDELDSLGLTERQRLFVQYYLAEPTAAQAAIKAGYKDSQAIYKTAHDLLRLPKIRTAIRLARMRQEEEITVTNAMIISQLARIAFADINDFIDYEERPPVRVVDPETGNVTWENFDSVKVKPGAKVDGSVIAEVRQTRDGIAFKRYDAMDALKTLAKIKGMLTDNVNVKHSGEVTQRNEQHYHIIQQVIEQSANPSDVIRSIFRRPGVGQPTE